MSMEIIGPIVMFIMLLAFVLVVGVVLSGDEGGAPNGDNKPRHSLE